MSTRSLKIIVLHLDLGIGGAEQLIVSVSKAVQELGHEVTLMTTHHDINHAFEETKPDGILGSRVFVYGDWLPRQIFNRFTALFAILRMIYLAFVVVLLQRNVDLVILDGISAPIPILKFFGFRVLFYCHFPDQLLCTDRGNPLKQVYRTFVDKVEEVTTGRADRILVNSAFTLNVFSEVFPQLYKRRKPEILYPVVPKIQKADFEQFRQQHLQYTHGYNSIFISVNRLLQADYAKNLNGPVLLIIAGGYDLQVDENVDYFEELCALCKKENLNYRHIDELGRPKDCALVNENVSIVFRRSIPTAERNALFGISKALLYTPDREHFGIVPLEAMSIGLPVIAVNSGGPTESVLHEKTGFLCSQDADEFAKRMFFFASKLDPDSCTPHRMKSRAIEWVKSKFSDVAMKAELAKIFNDMKKE
eukprot:gene27-29_t